MASSALGASVVTGSAHGHAGRPPACDELLRLSARQAVRLMKEGSLKAETYARALLARAEEIAPLNAFIAIDEVQLLEAAREADRRRRRRLPLGRLHGLPIAFKDVINTTGLPTTYATASLLGFTPRRNAAVVDALMAEGALLFGKTNCDELSYGSGSLYSAFGPVHNPYDATRITGGSSGGSAVAAATRTVPIAFGADTTGSVRMPGSLTGAKAFRPTTGRYSTAGVWPITPALDALGPLGHAVEDFCLMDAVLAADSTPFPRPRLSSLRIGVSRKYYFELLEPEVADIIEGALRRLREAGATIVEVDFPHPEWLDPYSIPYPILFADTWSSMAQFISETDVGITLEQVYEQLTPEVKGLWDQLVVPGAPAAFPPEVVEEARRNRLLLMQAFADYFAQNRLTALAIPGVPFAATRMDQATVEIGGSNYAVFDIIERSTAPGSAAAVPGLSIPVGKTRAGLPVALQLDGPRGRDRALLSAGLAIEPVFRHALSP